MSGVGETLRRAREARRITLNQAALETRIRQAVLEAIEADDYRSLPPRPFVTGLLRNYAQYLGLDAESIVAEFKMLTTPGLGGAPGGQESHESRSPFPTASTPYPFSPGDQRDAETSAFPPFPLSSRGSTELSSQPPPISAREEFGPHSAIHPSITTQAHPDVAPEMQPAQHEAPTVAQRIGSTRLPEVFAIVALAIALFALISVGITQIPRLQAFLAMNGTATPSPSPSPTLPAGIQPTPVPTIPPTDSVSGAPLSPAAPLNSTPQLSPTRIQSTATHTPPPSPTLNVPPDSQMILELEASEPMFAQVIVDDQQVHNGVLENDARSWTARFRLFIYVKDIANGRVIFNGKRILPRNQQERFDLYRLWELNPQGTPVSIPLTPASPQPSPTSTAQVTETPVLTPTPRTLSQLVVSQPAPTVQPIPTSTAGSANATTDKAP